MTLCVRRRACLIWAAALNAILLAGCGGPASDKGGKPSAGKGVPPAAPVAVTIDGITKEYVDNADTADKKYKDKLLQFEGVLYLPPEGSLLVRVLLKDPSAKDQNKSGTVRWVPKSELNEKAKTLKTGQKVKVKGKCAGQNGLGDIKFVDVIEGEIIDVGPAPKD